MKLVLELFPYAGICNWVRENQPHNYVQEIGIPFID